MIKLSDYIFQQVAKYGVRHVFMLAGGGAMHLVDSLGRNKDLTYICNLHEQCATIAAEAYSQYTGNLGVALVTSGPGGTNAITGVAAAWLDSTPMLVISGQVKRSDMNIGKHVRQFGYQELNIVDIVKPITKYAFTVMDPDSIRYHIEKAIHLAKFGRPGPVWLDIPLDVQSSMVDESRLKGFTDLTSPPDTYLSKQVFSTAALLEKAEKPVILAGNGIRLAGARELFIRTVSELGIPVLLTWRAADLLPATHPLFCGRPGLIGQKGANETQDDADLIICIGARLDMGQTSYSHDKFAPNAHRVVVDIDQNEIDKMRCRIDIPIVCDAGDFLYELLKLGKRRDYSSWSLVCRERHILNPVSYPSVQPILDRLTPSDVLVLSSSGAASERVLQSINVPDGLRIINSPGLGSMGFAVPASIGAALASNKHVVCIDGDGSFAMNIQELEVIDRLNLPIDIYVLMNDGYGSIKDTQTRHFESRYVGCSPSSGLTFPGLNGYNVHPVFLDSSEVTLRYANA